MTDPRNTDPRRQDVQFSKPVRHREEGADRMWGWVAGLAVVVLLAFIVIVGWNAGGPETASNAPQQNAPAATTTGQSLTTPPAQSPAPDQSTPKAERTVLPAPSPTPAPNKGTQ
jgi:hypothetical protein